MESVTSAITFMRLLGEINIMKMWYLVRDMTSLLMNGAFCLQSLRSLTRAQKGSQLLLFKKGIWLRLADPKIISPKKKWSERLIISNRSLDGGSIASTYLCKHKAPFMDYWKLVKRTHTIVTVLSLFLAESLNMANKWAKKWTDAWSFQLMLPNSRVASSSRCK